MRTFVSDTRTDGGSRFHKDSASPKKSKGHSQPFGSIFLNFYFQKYGSEHLWTYQNSSNSSCNLILDTSYGSSPHCFHTYHLSKDTFKSKFNTHPSSSRCAMSANFWALPSTSTPLRMSIINDTVVKVQSKNYV